MLENMKSLGEGGIALFFTVLETVLLVARDWIFFRSAGGREIMYL